MALRRILVANRGEIALRIVRAARSLGIETVLAASAADRDSMAAREADRVVVIGPPAARNSYLNPRLIVHAATATGCDGLHPGYGFLSERQSLAALCDEAGVVFVGPTAESIEAVGDKLSARRLAKAAGIAMTPGSEKLATAAEAVAFAEGIGFPVVTKASAGGGGRGMVVARDARALADGFERASIEAKEAFGDGTLYIERYVEHARHVEVQVLGLGDGRVLHFGERDCSLQRRYQKMVEEAPAAALPETTRNRLHKAAVDLLASIRYRNAGTVEFLYDVERDDFYFMEVNARIQVEHPVSEMITGVGPRPAAAKDRGGRAASHPAARYRPPRPCNRGPHHRRESRPRFCAVSRTDSRLAASAWRRHTARHGHGGRRRRASFLRQHDRKAYRPRARPFCGGRALASGA